MPILLFDTDVGLTVPFPPSLMAVTIGSRFLAGVVSAADTAIGSDITRAAARIKLANFFFILISPFFSTRIGGMMLSAVRIHSFNPVSLTRLLLTRVLRIVEIR